MPEEIEEKKVELRKIRLRNGEPSQANWFNEAFEAETGKTYSVKPSLAQMTISSGKFEYVGEETPEVNADFDALPEGFPKREELAAGGFATLSAINAATDDELLAVENFGKKSLEAVREAAAKLNEGENDQ